MEGLINVQKGLKNSIDKGLVNFKKSPKERITKEYVVVRLENLERDWLLFRANHSKLNEQYKPDVLNSTIYVTEEWYVETEDSYSFYKSHLKIVLSKMSPIVKDSGSGGAKCEPNSLLVKLPKISIPIFSGKYSEWTTFRDLFVSLVHKNTSLDNVQRLHYLKSHLTGEAEQLIRHTPITDANYHQCWEQLEKRYNNKKYLANCILKRLFSQKRTTFESASALRELLDTTTDCLHALQNLKIDVSTWDIIIIHIISYKLDFETRKQWELHVTENNMSELPTFDQFKAFIEGRFRALECLEPKRSMVHQINSTYHPKALVGTSKSASSIFRCEYCSEPHKLCFCKKFSAQSYVQKREFVVKHNMCFNCLGGNHTVYECKKTTSCKVCRKRHHTLLHPIDEAEPKQNTTGIGIASSSANDAPIVSCMAAGRTAMSKQILLATALIKAESKSGDFQTIRALVDQGSQACFITEATVQFLRLKKIPIQGLISGIGQNKSIITKHMVNLVIKSRVEPQIIIKTKAYVLNNITSYLPEKRVNALDWTEISGLELADPEFSLPNRIDVLLGAEIYSCVLKEGMVKNPTKTLTAQSTALGWIISGAVSSTNQSSDQTSSNVFTLNISVLHAQVSEDDILRKFWEIEDQPNNGKKLLSIEEQLCEDLYKKSTKRTNDGRYVVKLPFKDDDPKCTEGQSRQIAISRLLSLERRLAKDNYLKQKYSEVINEYLELDHMRPVRCDDAKRDKAVYLPHHAVVRSDRTTTKVRVVFNASEQNKNGVSLNSTLMIGPTLQADLRHTVSRWRIYPIGIVADIVKMYRQVRIAEEDTSFQRIVWRNSPDETLQDYELLTVTFGTASAPYLAVRSLHQVAYDEGHKYPLAAEKVLNCFYMDDLMTGCESVEDGNELVKQINGLLNCGGFELQKWNSNCEDLLRNMHDEKKPEKEIKLDTDKTIKILGLTWNPKLDHFQYTVNLPTIAAGPVTKRTIISEIARLFDPLGWIAPSIVIAKTFIQKLWLSGLGWDDKLSSELLNEWDTYRTELSELTKIKIPRWLTTRTDDVSVELHGFSDASKTAYSAVVYIRVIDVEGQVHVSLLVAKTRVAPIKQISIPRLELCGAVLLTRLLLETAEVLSIPKENISAWTDSTVVLAWINSHPSRWHIFVGNRVSEILTAFNSAQWHHVSTKQNPADCASRGLLPKALIDNSLWFSGPTFLKDKIVNKQKTHVLSTNLEENIKVHSVTIPETPLFEKFSSLQRLTRVVAYCKRFLNKNKGHLKKIELDDALQCCIKETQRNTFLDEYNNLVHNKPVQPNSKLKSLSPFIDENGIIRLGGRLHHADLDENIKHPIILPKDAHITRLIIAESHIKTLHGGQSLMMSYLRSAYWIIGAKNLVKQHISRCVTCFRQRANIKNQIMGSLPSVRCVPARAFINSGVDYAGPVNLKTTKGRGHRSYKGYICLFICMVTRAIHLEVVSDMTTQAFLAAFKRFVSRRGHCAHLWSDNGTTFVGAARELQDLTVVQQNISEHLARAGTEWHFIPPRAPNFGGLWEAGVKATKFHLKRVIGDSTLTYEEMSTLLCQVEACLNSRPMSVINNVDPDEPLPLTPGHFLVGEPLLSIPDHNYENSNCSGLSRWQYVQRLLQTFWRRWSSEYLSTLVNRYKWSEQRPEPNINDVVLIKEDDMPPSRWLLGRIIQKHPGRDNITRVVTLKTNSSIVKRPTSKICVLPISS